VAEAFGIDSPLSFTERDWRTRPVVTAVLPLYTGGVIPAAQRGQRRPRTGQRRARSTRQSLTVQLAQAYFGQRLAEQAVDVRRDVRDGLNRHLSDAEKLEREGFATRAQRLQATVARDKAEREARRRNDLATLKAALATLLRSGGEVQPVSPLFVQRAPLEPVASFERTAQAAAAAGSRACGRWWRRPNRACACSRPLKPQIRLRPVRLPPPRRNADRSGLGVRHRPEVHLPVAELATGADRAARAQQEQAEAGLREAENQVALGVRKAWNELETARQQFVLLDSSIAQAQENLRLQELAFREGQATSLDVIDARLGLRRPRRARAGRLPIRYCAGTVAGDQWTDGPFRSEPGGGRTR
jgi:hypothetical protein